MFWKGQQTCAQNNIIAVVTHTQISSWWSHQHAPQPHARKYQVDVPINMHPSNRKVVVLCVIYGSVLTTFEHATKLDRTVCMCSGYLNQLPVPVHSTRRSGCVAIQGNNRQRSTSELPEAAAPTNHALFWIAYTAPSLCGAVVR